MKRIKRMLKEKGIKQTWLATAQRWISYKLVIGSIHDRYETSPEIIYQIIGILVISPEELLSHPKLVNNG